MPGTEASPAPATNPKGSKRCILKTRNRNKKTKSGLLVQRQPLLFFFSFVRPSGVLYTLVNIERGHGSMACAGCHVRRVAEGAGTSYIEKSDQQSGPQSYALLPQ